MKLTCSNCRREMQIDDAKAPAGSFQVKCPQCGQTIQARNENAAASEDVNPTIARYVKRELEALKRELMQTFGTQSPVKNNGENLMTAGDDAQPSTKSALVCESDPKFSEEFSRLLKNMGYVVDRALSKEESDRKIEANFYQVIILDSIFPDDKEGGQKILATLNSQKSAQRRQTFVVLLSTTAKSAGAEAAFLQGANLVVNKEELKGLEPALREGQKTFRQLYSVLNSLIHEKNMRS